MRSLKRTISQNAVRAVASRRGVTLMEVLMSVMIMGLGVIPLATLFPISVKRSAQATQLTNATILRYNAEAMLDAFPGRLLHDPDNDGNRDEHRYTNRKYMVDPIGYLLADDPAYQGRFGNDGQGNAYGNVLRFDAGFTAMGTGPNFFAQQDSWVLQFEGIPISNSLTGLEFDSTELTTELMTDIDQNAVDGYSQGIWSRIVIFDESGKVAQIRPLTSISPTDISNHSLTGFTALPDNLRYVASDGTGIVSKVRIEIQEQRYSYMFSVRHQPTRVAAVDVVVFFKRDFSPLSEVVHSVSNFVRYTTGADGSPGVDGVDDNQDGNTDDRGELGWKGSDDEPNYQFTLHYNNNITGAPLNMSVDDIRPPLRKGGYLFDVKNARWYRIQNFTENSTATAALVTLDQPIAEDIRTSGGSATTADGVIVRSDVVQVYALGNKLDPSN
ncbi:type IV pilus modification PilV family protein [Gimesia sp.]|uniref:type IV pilus modification PilV family protein n=1 Tax=Gimesia sp. TaxID=2024833 RepID=UPI003A90C6A4